MVEARGSQFWLEFLPPQAVLYEEGGLAGAQAIPLEKLGKSKMLAGEGGTKIKCWILIWTQIPYSNPQNLAETSENFYRYQTLVRYTIFLFF